MRDIDLSAIRAKLAGQQGPDVLAQPRGSGGDARVRGDAPPGVPGGGLGADRSGRSPRLLAPDGCVAGARRRGGLHQAAARVDRALRAGARGDHPGQAAVLRHRDALCRELRCRCSSKARWAGRPRSSPTPQHPFTQRRHRRLRAGVGADAVRSGSFADADVPRRDPSVSGVFRGDDRRVARSRRRRGPASGSSPRRCRRRRSPRRSRRCWQEPASGQVDSVRPGEPRCRPGRGAPGVRRIRRAAASTRAGRRHPVARSGLSRLRSGQAARRTRFRGPAPRRRRRRDEPPLRRRECARRIRARRPTIDCRSPRATSPRSRAPWRPASASPAPRGPRRARSAALVAAVVKDLQAHRGRSLVVAGDTQPAAVHALAACHEHRARERRDHGRLHGHARGRSDRAARRACASSSRT